MCLITLNLIRKQWTLLHISQVWLDFIDKLSKTDNKNGHIGRDPVFTRGHQDIKETVISDGGDEPLGIPEDMETRGRIPAQECPAEDEGTLRRTSMQMSPPV